MARLFLFGEYLVERLELEIAGSRHSAHQRRSVGLWAPRDALDSRAQSWLCALLPSGRDDTSDEMTRVWSRTR